MSILTPADGESGVSLNPSIQIQFNESVNNIESSGSVTLHQGSVSGTEVALAPFILGSNNTYSFSSVEYLEAATTYYLVLESAIKDNNGQALNYTVFSFTTGAKPIPQVTLVRPTNGSSTASVNQVIKIQFSKDVLNVNTTNIKLYESAVGGTLIAIGTPTFESNNVYSFIPTTPLNELVTYYLVVESGITDTESPANKLNTTTFDFTTLESPQVSSIIPINNAVGISLLPTIQLVFNQVVQNVSENTTLRIGSIGGPIVPSIVMQTTDNITYDFNSTIPLDLNTNYYVVVNTGVTNLAGDPLLSVFNYNFTTGARPQVVMTVPNDNETGIYANPLIIIKFSESVQDVESSISMLNGVIPVGISTVVESSDGLTYIFTPSASLLGSTNYTVIVESSVTNLVGDNMASAYQFSFTTESAPSFILATAESPALGSYVSLSNNFTLLFSQIVNGLNTTTPTVCLSTNSGLCIVNGITGINNSGSGLAFYLLNSGLVENTTYYLLLTSGITNNAGFMLQNPGNVASFMTLPRPTIASNSVIPSAVIGGESVVSINPTINVTFNESVSNVVGNLSLHESSPSGVIRAINTPTTSDGITYSFTAESALNESKVYYVVAESSITNLVGDTMLSRESFSFTTTILPQVVMTVPNSNETRIYPNPTIAIKFNESVLHAESAMKLESAGGVVAISLVSESSDGLTYTFSPNSNLSSLASYVVTVESTVTNLIGDQMSADYVFSFTAGDYSPPVVSLIYPTNGTSNVSVAVQNIQLNFNQVVQGVSESTVKLCSNVLCQASQVVATTNIVQNINGNYYFSPNLLLTESSIYYIVFESGITNIYGVGLNFLGTPFSFNTAPAPTVNSTNPNNGQTNVATGASSFSITFGSTMNPNTINTSTVTATVNGMQIPISFYQAIGQTYIFSINLLPYSTYTVNLTNGITDAESNPIISTNYSFTTKSGQWTWTSGESTTNALGVYTGTPVPGSRNAAAIWIDSSDNIWMFGGSGCDTSVCTGKLNDLWKYSILLNQWTFVSGNTISNQAPNYGTKNVANVSNNPGGRNSMAYWSDKSGKLWLLGGANNSGNLNDLWKYDIESGMWTWVSGESLVNRAGTYGSKGNASTTYTPGARNQFSGWSDESGNFWIFGGIGCDHTAGCPSGGGLNDLWKFNPNNLTWTWVAGESIKSQSGIYNMGESNYPGSRWGYVAMVDSSNHVWLFGGAGCSGVPSCAGAGYLNDLWKYYRESNTWVWVAGESVANRNGIYGTKGVPSIANKPGGRANFTGWIDPANNVWILGGFECAVSGGCGAGGNDLWRYTPSTGGWMWASGESTTGGVGIYGTKGTPNIANTPAQNFSGAGVVSSSGAIWLFGGSSMNTLWRYQ